MKEVLESIQYIMVIVSILVTAAVFIIKWTNKVGSRLNSIEQKLNDLPTVIELSMINKLLPFASSIINQQNNPLSPDEIVHMRKLMNKLQAKSISSEEANKLQYYLEIEKEEAESKNNGDLLLAIGIALAAIALIAYINKK